MRNPRRMTTIAASAAMIFVVTWLVKIPIPVSGGAYLNFGDIVIYMASYILGGPSAALAAAIGSAAADLAGGAAIYAIPTFVIKALMALAAGAVGSGGRFGRYLLGCVLGGAIMTGGYALFEVFFFDPAYALASLPFNLTQWGGSVAAAAALFEPARRLASRYRRGDSYGKSRWAR